MKIRLFVVFILAFIAMGSCENGNGSGKSIDSGMDPFIDELLDRMTLEEKIGQLNLVSVGFDVTGPRVSQQVEEKIANGQVGGVFNSYTTVAVRKLQELAVNESRLGIPLIFGFDVVHGHRTVFPVPLGLAATWDPEAIEETARIAALEASLEGLNWTFSPMVDIARDPRWGRICEGSGEDAWYGSLVARAMVRGYQGEDLSGPHTVMACVKHFALYGAAEAGRDYNNVDMSLRRMREVYLPPYRAAVEEGAGSVMTSFNDISGIPASANRWLLTDLLRKEWGFTGFVVTDYTTLEELIPFGVAADKKEAARLALEAGVDMDMVSEVLVSHTGELVEEGILKEERVDAACRRILEAKYRLGLFDDPFRYVKGKESGEIELSPGHREYARQMARKSMILLKNDHHTLPLDEQSSIALIGPLVYSRRDVQGNWRGGGRNRDAVTVEEGVRSMAGEKARILTAQGANITDDTLMLFKLNAHGGEIDYHDPATLLREALGVASRADVIVAVVGESQGMSGESASRSGIGIPGSQKTLLKALKKTGKPLVIVLMNGRPLTLEWEQAHADAILETWFAGTEAGNAIADVLFGAYNPSGKLTVTFPRNVGQIPLYYNHHNIGRPYAGDILDKFKSQYLDAPNDPLYPFGYGLSYTTFSMGDPVLGTTRLVEGDTLSVSVEVQNTGPVPGEEVVQLYVQDLVASVTRPVKELKGFKRILLDPGESETVTFTLRADDLRFYNRDMDFVTEPGDFKIFTGPDSRNVKEAIFTLVRE